MKKKLQVFVSSTYTDLTEERQAAVEAILDAGHIPAGMELFKAGNDSQLKTIYKWIDESDVYMLILGGRYGSIEPETGKSYTQLEYEYALQNGIPIFSVIISEKFLELKIASQGLGNVVENTSLYSSFKELVMSKIIREVDDSKDIKLAIHSTLNKFINEYELRGWVRGDNENKTIKLLNDNYSLIKENNKLSKQLEKLQKQVETKSSQQLGNFTFDELIDIFRNKTFDIPENISLASDALNIFISNYNIFCTGISNRKGMNLLSQFLFFNISPYFIGFDLLEKVKIAGSSVQRIQTTKLGNSFYAMLETNNIME